MMTDPVILPSGTVVDRATILRHILSDPRDPFSRVPLSESDLKPHTELKAQIDVYKARKGKKKDS